MSELRSIAYTVTFDAKEGETNSKKFALTLKTLEQDAEKVDAELARLAKTIGGKLNENMTITTDKTKTARIALRDAAREAGRAEKQYSKLAREYVHVNSLVGKTAEQIEILNAQFRLGSGATQKQKDDISALIKKHGSLNSALKKSGKSTQGFGRNAGMAGVQVQQFMGQIQGGQNALLAFGQQSADIGIVLGAPMLGAIAGISASLIGIFLPALFDSGKAVDGLVEKMEAWKKTIGLTREQADFLINTEVESAKVRAKSIATYTEEITAIQKTLANQKLALETFDLTVKARKKMVEAQRKSNVELTTAVALRQSEVTAVTDSTKKIDVYNSSVGMGTDKIKENKEAIKTQNESLDKLIKSLAVESALITGSIGEKNRSKALQLGANEAQLKAVDVLSDLIQKHKDEQKAIAGASVEKRKAIALAKKELEIQAKYDPQAKLTILKSQYNEERKLLKGNTSALEKIDRNYARNKLAINGDMWEKAAAQLEASLENSDDLMMDSIGTFTSGFGQAMSDAVLESENLGDAMSGLFKNVTGNMISFFAEWAAQKMIMWALDETIGSSVQASAAVTTTANAEAGVLLAGINAYASAAAIPFVGFAMAPAASAAAMAVTQPLATAASASAFAGVFDAGGDIGSGKYGIVSEIGDELVGGTMVYNGSQSSLAVTGREDTAKMMGGGQTNITIQSSGNASPEAIARQVNRVLKKGGKGTQTAIYDATIKGQRNRGKKR